MTVEIVKLLAFVAVGLIWRQFSPMQISAGQLQRALTALLYTVFIPALILQVLWNAPMNQNTLRVVLVVALSTGLTLAGTWFLLSKQSWPSNIKGALLLAAAFSNVLFLGMPLSQSMVASWTVRTAVEFEAFAVFPIALTAGVILASKFGGKGKQDPWMDLIKEPVIWATVLGLLFNFLDVKGSRGINTWLNMMAVAIVPMLLITVGLALQWNKSWSKIMPALGMVAALQLVVLPIVVWILANVIGLVGQQTLKSLVLQAAMPAMILGFTICERYKLDATAYTAAFSFTTGAAIITVPLWHMAMTSGLIK